MLFILFSFTLKDVAHLDSKCISFPEKAYWYPEVIGKDLTSELLSPIIRQESGISFSPFNMDKVGNTKASLEIEKINFQTFWKSEPLAKSPWPSSEAAAPARSPETLCPIEKPLGPTSNHSRVISLQQGLKDLPAVWNLPSVQQGKFPKIKRMSQWLWNMTWAHCDKVEDGEL